MKHSVADRDSIKDSQIFTVGDLTKAQTCIIPVEGAIEDVRRCLGGRPGSDSDPPVTIDRAVLKVQC
jgi:hypothetical protein